MLARVYSRLCFFDKEILMTSNAKGGGRGAYSALNPTIIQAIESKQNLKCFTNITVHIIAYVMKEYAAAKPATVADLGWF